MSREQSKQELMRLDRAGSTWQYALCMTCLRRWEGCEHWGRHHTDRKRRRTRLVWVDYLEFEDERRKRAERRRKP